MSNLYDDFDDSNDEMAVRLSCCLQVVETVGW